MKRILIYTICSLFSIFTHSSDIDKNSTVIQSDLSTKIHSFYRAYIINSQNDYKKDSILTEYCTNNLKSVVENEWTKDGYDFVLDGGGAEFCPDSIIVTKKNDKYVVFYKYSQYPISDKLATDSLYILVNQEQKISHIIRPCDNYKIPNDD
ncbi:MAG: hypothetical protein MJY74_05740 [Bacteroidaceae bacterium]|nr:hypothetical protein [Bacteroidaceae bacterium]